MEHFCPSNLWSVATKICVTKECLTAFVKKIKKQTATSLTHMMDPCLHCALALFP